MLVGFGTQAEPSTNQEHREFIEGNRTSVSSALGGSYVKPTKEERMLTTVDTSRGARAPGAAQNVSRVVMRNVAHATVNGGGGVNCILPQAGARAHAWLLSAAALQCPTMSACIDAEPWPGVRMDHCSGARQAKHAG